MAIIALLLTALLFGGMVLYSFGFAAFLFSALPSDVAGSTIRRAFPMFYLFVAITATIAGILVWQNDGQVALILGIIALTVVPTRQLLLPAINRATDTGQTKLFHQLHTVSVLITLSHIGLTGYALIRLGG